jgi:hypothetical protein
VRARLQHYEIFSTDDQDRARAREIDLRFFPNGLDFIILPFLTQHAESARPSRSDPRATTTSAATSKTATPP